VTYQRKSAFITGHDVERIESQAGQGHVFFVDAAHFVFGTFLCCLWSFAQPFVRAVRVPFLRHLPSIHAG